MIAGAYPRGAPYPSPLHVGGERESCTPEGVASGMREHRGAEKREVNVIRCGTPQESAFFAYFLYRGVWTGDMMDACADTWLTDYAPVSGTLKSICISL